MSREAFHLLLEKYLNNSCTPEEKEIVEKWYGMLDKQDLAAEEITGLEEKLWDKIHEAAIPARQEPAQPASKPNYRLKQLLRFSAAAVLAGLLLSAGYLFFGNKSRKPEFVVSNVSNGTMKYANTGDKPVTIKLEDGSSVILQPKAVLKYPSHFSAALREVALEGEGFFEISKNPLRPFLVYNKNVITRVVGTSFTVKTNHGKNETEVIVKTGKVVVSPNSGNVNLKALLKSRNGVILTPNQKTVYNASKNTFATSLVDHPEPIELKGSKAPVKENYLFNDTPVATVLTQLQKSYGIEFIVEDKQLYTYTFTGDLSEQNLYRQLDFLCESIGASYKPKGTKIMISSKE
ncbi:transmembrane sensor [Pedobacter africanus]|uniref:Ferric-dicitrate binding protein FerR (Iron transport regulator) n=1 Tax=Pedobacter africanus TaxID=151894 RepID=A0ACC6KVM3_9SPHI|nr:FecR family protein [Pedobacter africanus]MDR6783121.1 ferric-dicitrate binding protein FerR (iron transport regulator) [Pedobacter africanus]